MKKLLILGSGTAGTMMANKMRRKPIEMALPSRMSYPGKEKKYINNKK